ncbi:D-amino-acid transaminase [Risungbinella massiliensis]|uniref:D-amino-acid transaminase n=1 Tax=Risungbinella massiliensis TaxID=1329796 RepID=UPI000B0F153B|nr:D-amino-acid transaminase [Risungbinella massiliensis]
MYYLQNNEFVERHQVHVDLEDRGYQFGDGVYEVIRVYDQKPFYLAEHLTRLFRSASEIRINLSFSIEELTKRLHTLINKNNLIHGNLYLQVSRGIAPRNHAFPKEAKPVFIAYTIPSDRPIDTLEQGVKAITTQDIRWLRCDIKSLNLLGAVLAKQEAVDAGCSEAILIRDQVVTEGSSTNIFFVKEGKLITHPANQLILHGITREIVLEQAKKLQLPIVFEALSHSEIGHVDECFMTSTTMEVCPIIQIDEKPIGDGTPGSLTRQLQAAYIEEIARLALVSN